MRWGKSLKQRSRNYLLIRQLYVVRGLSESSLSLPKDDWQLRESFVLVTWSWQKFSARHEHLHVSLHQLVIATSTQPSLLVLTCVLHYGWKHRVITEDYHPSTLPFFLLLKLNAIRITDIVVITIGVARGCNRLFDVIATCISTLLVGIPDVPYRLHRACARTLP
jgi:hypothetical protein